MDNVSRHFEQKQDEELRRIVADHVRYFLATAIEERIRKWGDIRIAVHEGEIGGYLLRDDDGRGYRVRLTVEPVDE